MRTPPAGSPLPHSLDAIEHLKRWPTARPAACLLSGRSHSRWARWSIVGEPVGWVVHQGGRTRWVEAPNERAGTARCDGLATGPAWARDWTHDPVEDLSRAVAGVRELKESSDGKPGLIGYLSYDLFRSIEPSAAIGEAESARSDDRDWPAFAVAWCPHARRLPPVDFAAADDRPPGMAPGFELGEGFVGDMESSTTDEQHARRVARTIEYIAAGDIFQANITQRLSAPFRGNVRQLAECALRESRAWFGAHIELPDGRAIVSMSPELFLQVDGATHEVITRPIKGTRSAAAGAAELALSAKDAAELHMIVDLMRNDLGRVCEFGSVRVCSAREVEEHPTIFHGVAEVAGTLRRGVTIGDLMRATFPPGSVTGVPKIRAMQVIEEMEPVRRGPYCGAIGWFGANGDVVLSVAIRTMALSGRRPGDRFDMLDGTLDYGPGGAIVADSQPAEEVRECKVKAAMLHRVIDAFRERERSEHAIKVEVLARNPGRNDPRATRPRRNSA